MIGPPGNDDEDGDSRAPWEVEADAMESLGDEDDECEVDSRATWEREYDEWFSDRDLDDDDE